MKWRYGFLACCAVLITAASTTIVSSKEVAWLCCETTGSCPAAQLCCDADSVGRDPCDDNNPNYCMDVCKRVAGASTFTPDQQ